MQSSHRSVEQQSESAEAALQAQHRTDLPQAQVPICESCVDPAALWLISHSGDLKSLCGLRPLAGWGRLGSGDGLALRRQREGDAALLADLQSVVLFNAIAVGRCHACRCTSPGVALMELSASLALEIKYPAQALQTISTDLQYM